MADDTDAEQGVETIAEGFAQSEQPEEVAQGESTTYTLSDGTSIPLEDLEKGYLRQGDYTRKTQELAQQRAEASQALALMQALADNPEETLDALRSNLIQSDTDDIDPTELQLRQHEERFAQLEEERFTAELDHMLTDLSTQYAEYGFDRDAVLEWAVTHEIPNLEAAFLHMHAKQEADKDRQQRNADVVAKKRAAPPIGGRSRQLGGDTPPRVEVGNVRDAMANALAELDLSDWP